MVFQKKTGHAVSEEETYVNLTEYRRTTTTATTPTTTWTCCFLSSKSKNFFSKVLSGFQPSSFSLTLLELPSFFFNVYFVSSLKDRKIKHWKRGKLFRKLDKLGGLCAQKCQILITLANFKSTSMNYSGSLCKCISIRRLICLEFVDSLFCYETKWPTVSVCWAS